MDAPATSEEPASLHWKDVRLNVSKWIILGGGVTGVVLSLLAMKRERERMAMSNYEQEQQRLKEEQRRRRRRREEEDSRKRSRRRRSSSSGGPTSMVLPH